MQKNKIACVDKWFSNTNIHTHKMVKFILVAPWNIDAHITQTLIFKWKILMELPKQKKKKNNKLTFISF